MTTRVFLLVSLCFSAPFIGRGATVYNFMDIITPGPYSIAYGISNAGAVVGISGVAPAAPTSGFIRGTNGVLQTFDVPFTSTFGTEARAINNSGEVVGTYFPSGSARSGFFRSASGLYNTVLDGSTVRGINDLGLIAGSTGTTGEITTLGGPVTTFLIPGSTFLFADGINDAGQVVGYYSNATGTHGFLRNADGTIVTLDVPGSVGTTVANGLNDLGQIVGYYSDGSTFHGYIRDANGVYVMIDHPTSGFPVSTFLYDINDSGIIVGSYGSNPSVSQAFTATPSVPEPASGIPVALAVLSGIMWSRRYRKTQLSVDTRL